MFYPGMPDIYQYKEKDLEGGHNVYNVFWHDGEFYFLDRSSSHRIRRDDSYFDDVNELLLAMLKVAPYKEWKRVETL